MENYVWKIYGKFRNFFFKLKLSNFEKLVYQFHPVKTQKHEYCLQLSIFEQQMKMSTQSWNVQITARDNVFAHPKHFTVILSTPKGKYAGIRSLHSISYNFGFVFKYSRDKCWSRLPRQKLAVKKQKNG